MRRFSAEEFLKIEGTKILGNPFASFKGLSYDTREIEKDNLFVAIKGENCDGNDFVEKAFEKGASVSISSRKTTPKENCALIYSDSPERCIQNFASSLRENFNGVVVGVVGSTGKTTTKDFCAKFLSSKDLTYSNEGNKNNLLGLPQSIVNADFEAKYWVLEMGISLPSEMDSLAKIAKPNVVVFTAIKPVHLEFMHSLESIFYEKAKVLNYLLPPSCFIYNKDDKYLSKLPEMFDIENYSYGFSQDSDLKMTLIANLGIEGFIVKFDFKKQRSILHLPFLNIANLYNFAASYLLSLVFYNDVEVARTVLPQITPLDHRGKISILKNGAILYDDSYNSNPEAVKILLESCKSWGGNVIAVLGEMKELGKESEMYHKEIGILASEILSSLICVGNNGAKAMYEEFKKTNKPCYYAPNWNEAINCVRFQLKSGSKLIVKGSRAISLEKLVDEIIKDIGVKE